jgi:type I restriction enzyme S subunit
MVKLPEGWERRRLGDVSSVIMGQSPSSSLINKEGKGLPFLQGNAEFTSKYPNPINWIEKPLKTASKGSILVSVRAPIGDLNFANSQCCIGRGLASIEANGFIVDNNFLWYSMHYFINELIKIGQGSTFEAIGRNELRNLCISLPPLPEQRKIAEILETADKAIEKTDAIIEKYRRIKQGLMRDLLTKGIDEKGQIRSEETHKFKDSPLGRLPEEWEVVRLGEIISVYDKKRIPLDSEFRLTIKGNIPYCGATGVIDYINDYIFDGEYLLIAEDGGNFGAV